MKEFTNANFAYHLSRIDRLIANTMAELASGMSNPDYCSADGTVYAISVCEEIKLRLNHMDMLMKAANNAVPQLGDKEG